MLTTKYVPVELLHFASFGNQDRVRDILRHNPEFVNYQNKMSDTALILAAKFNFVDVIRILYEEFNADVNSVSVDGTALDVAIKNGSADAASYLMGVTDLGLVCNEGNVFYKKAKEAASIELLVELQERGGYPFI